MVFTNRVIVVGSGVIRPSEILDGKLHPQKFTMTLCIHCDLRPIVPSSLPING